MVDISLHPKTRNEFALLTDKARRVVRREFAGCEALSNEQMENLPDKLSSDELIESFLTPAEEIAPIPPLFADSFSIQTLPELNIEPIVGYGVELRLTNKRLILVDNTKEKVPTLSHEKEGKEENITVENEIVDSNNFISFDLNDIFDISMQIENRVKATTYIRNAFFGYLLPVGFLVMILGALYMFRLNFTMESLYAGGAIILLGLIISLLGIGLMTYRSEGPVNQVYKSRTLRIATLDPNFKQRALLTIRINPEGITARDIVDWTRSLQSWIRNITESQPPTKHLNL